jgi:hypothetical protein
MSAAAPLPVGQWHHLAAVEAYGTPGILYVDGQPVATNSSTWYGTEALGADYGESDIGRCYDGQDQYFHGTIDEVQLFTTARSAAQVLADFNEYPVPQPAPQLGSVASGNQSVIFWPATATNYILQSTTNLNSTNWTTVTDAVPVIAVTVTNNLPVRLFRLLKQP